MTAPLPRQLALALEHAQSFAREDFLCGPCNEAASALVERWPDWPAKAVALVGPQGCGKSHLGTIWAQDSGARFLSARELQEADLTRAFSTGALVLEDVSSSQLDERQLFHLLNLAREEGAFVLLTMRELPSTLTVTIPDLKSRLRALPVVAMTVPDDDLLRALIVKLAADRQLVFDEALVSYLVTRIERSFAAAASAVSRLDEEAMRQHRPVTRALATQLFRDV